MESFQPKSFVFVLMPFSPEFDDVYQIGIKQAGKNCDVYVERVDEQIFEGSIVERIYNQISKADIIIADMSGKNPNVFYETGYAHALGKNVILLAKSLDDIPFDLKHYTHIIYNNRLVDLIPELERRIRYFIENPKKTIIENNNIQVSLSGINENLDTTPLRIIKCTQSSVQYIAIQFYNNSHKGIKFVEFQYGFITPKMIPEITISEKFYQGNSTNLPKFQIDEICCLHYSDSDAICILPEGRIRRYIGMAIGSEIQSEVELIVRLFFKSGVADYPFTLNFEKI